jgi:hypothetical protein
MRVCIQNTGQLVSSNCHLNDVFYFIFIFGFFIVIVTTTTTTTIIMIMVVSLTCVKVDAILRTSVYFYTHNTFDELCCPFEKNGQLCTV